MTNGTTGKKEDFSLDSPDRVAELVAGLMDAQTPEEMKAKLRKWFRSSASETDKYLALQQWFDTLQENRQPSENDLLTLSRIHNILDFPKEFRVSSPHSKKTLLKKRVVHRIAAALIPAILILGSMLLWFKRGSDTLEAPIVEIVSVYAAANYQKHIFLPDSSEVWLNGTSTLTYSEEFLSDRRVQLSGEAFFSVRKNESFPFTVEINGIVATVLGTEFNVEAYTHCPKTVITLSSGSIAVEAGQRFFALKPGDRLVLGKGNYTAELKEDAGVLPTWRRGLEFHDSPLKTILEAIAYHFNLELEITGQLSDDHIRFGFDYDSSPELLLSILFKIHQDFTYEIKDDKIRITAY